MAGGKKGKGKNPHRKKNKNPPPPQPQAPGESSWDSLQNDDVMNILSRLPVKTLLRFRCVCKSWKSLIRSPKFISLHLTRHHLLSPLSRATTPFLLIRSVHKPTLDNKLSLFSLSHAPHPHSHALSQPLPHGLSLLIHALSVDSHALPLLSIHADLEELSRYYPKTLLDMDAVGSCNGVVCVSQPPRAHFISIFNPATRQHRLLRHTIPVPADPELDGRVSVGFGFDPISAHLKVISVLNFSVVSDTNTQVHVYNCSQDSWKIVTGRPYRFQRNKCEVIVGGVPYWLAFCLLSKDFVHEVVAYFDVHDEVFRHLILPPVAHLTGNGTHAKIDDWRGDLGLFVCPLNEDGDTFVDVWLLEVDGETGFKHWSKKHVVGPIFGMNWMFGCTRNGQIVGMDRELKLTLYDPDGGRVERRFDVGDDNVEQTFEVYNYRESLVSFKGESPIGKMPLQDEVEEASKRTGVSAKVRMDSTGDYEVVLPQNIPPDYMYVECKELLERGL